MIKSLLLYRSKTRIIRERIENKIMKMEIDNICRATGSLEKTDLEIKKLEIKWNKKNSYWT